MWKKEARRWFNREVPRLFGRAARRKKRSLLADVALGALAGGIGKLAMTAACGAVRRLERRDQVLFERVLRDGVEPAARLARKVAAGFGTELSPEGTRRLGVAFEWGGALGQGALYGLVRHYAPRVSLGVGLLFGTLSWALFNEGLPAAFKLSPPFGRLPWVAHARGLAGHLAYGAATEGTCRKFLS
jgi:hypothetical protein